MVRFRSGSNRIFRRALRDKRKKEQEELLAAQESADAISVDDKKKKKKGKASEEPGSRRSGLSLIDFFYCSSFKNFLTYPLILAYGSTWIIT